ncbi:MAG: FlgD immunoglobulin-like domain containing protein, partial [Candidatus Cloacimonetes bacterium]|nr:FlgD immunoglobulin-like domain containing protein [Candidatus Cloacimonadota bacterium]
LAPTPHLDGSYAIFGEIIEGLDVVMDIGEVPVDDNDRPLTPVNINSVDILDLIIGETMPPLGEVENTPGAPLMFYIEAYGENLNYDWYLEDELLQSGQNFIFEHSFTQAGEFIVRCHVSSAEFQHDLIWQVNSASGLDEAALPEMEQTRFYVQPNPFMDSVTLSYEIKTPSQVELEIYNLKGQIVGRMENESKAVGSYQVIWDGKDCQGRKVPSGIYLAKLKAGRESRTHKIMVLN